MKFLGRRKFVSNLVKFESLQPKLFTCRNTLQQLSWVGDDLEVNEWLPPSRDQLDPFCQSLNEVYGRSTHEMMRELFIKWPQGVIEEWAEDYNSEFRLKFDIFYESATMETTVYIWCAGVCEIDWHEYLDSYHQALTMHKLKEGL